MPSTTSFLVSKRLTLTKGKGEPLRESATTADSFEFWALADWNPRKKQEISTSIFNSEQRFSKVGTSQEPVKYYAICTTSFPYRPPYRSSHKATCQPSTARLHAEDQRQKSCSMVKLLHSPRKPQVGKRITPNTAIT